LSDSTQEQPFFELEHASVELDSGVRPLDAIDLRIGHGELVAVVGPSGAGKTTLLSLLNATRAVTGGRVRVDGVDLAQAGWTRIRRTRSRVGFVHQAPALVPNLRVAQNVLAGRLGTLGRWAGLRSIAWPRSADLNEVHELLERVGIADKLFQRTDTLSGGELQRAAIARALYQRPDALLADEPVAAVDPARARDILELLVGLARERGLPLVASLHDLELARDFFPRCVGLRSGRIQFDAPTNTLEDEDFDRLYRLTGTAAARNGSEVSGSHDS
jgi:phosphonate transport system ATP-binding protein